MKEAFDPQARLIPVRARLFGPTGQLDLALAPDTGATATLINSAHLESVGYDTTRPDDTVLVNTATGTQLLAKVSISRIERLGAARHNLPVLAAILPPTIGIDGLLGLDFFRRRRLTLDFRKGQIVLT